MRKLDEVVKKVQQISTMKLAVAAAQDIEVLEAVFDAKKQGIVEPILVGDIEKVKEIADSLGESLENIKLIEEKDLSEAAKIAVSLVSQGKADFVMKGILDTSILLKAVLDKEHGLRTDSLLSHLMVYEVPTYHKLLFLTDGGMNINPTLDEKAKILKNSIQGAKALGLDTVRVACLAAKEKVSEKMIATVDAAALQEKGQNGDFGEGVIVEGPLAFDLAVSKEAAQIKNFRSEVSGEVDVILVPNIEVGNGVGKSLTYMANAKSAGIIMGAKAPVVLVSRADDAQSKLYSIALGALIANYK
ncbi:bifunctional enoyl-CoA hydratase/phosphate acetyltransferase [Alkalithermobacter paradoxus]|uniref:Phosphate acetyltransferase n=1 Tax=Alkalithermobacter paradoxus TaxID=29349 RepID=A0A1V4I5J6_9FIRM|nr:phosphate acetyltransferase [[Clostridium] thermoalcaliphilum]